MHKDPIERNCVIFVIKTNKMFIFVWIYHKGSNNFSQHHSLPFLIFLSYLDPTPYLTPIRLLFFSFSVFFSRFPSISSASLLSKKILTERHFIWKPKRSPFEPIWLTEPELILVSATWSKQWLNRMLVYCRLLSHPRLYPFSSESNETIWEIVLA